MPLTDRSSRLAALTRALTVAALLLHGAAWAAEGGAWPQYRGVHRDGVAAADGLARGWPAAGPTVVWRVPLGSAFSQAAIQGDAVYTGTSDDKHEYVVRLDATTGREVWRSAIGDLFEESFGNGPRATPTVDGNFVYILSSRGNVVALAAADGARKWAVDSGQKFAAAQPRFGHAASPLVVGDLLIVGVGGNEDAAIVALDKASGKTRWSALSGGFGASSPIDVEVGGTRQIVFARGRTLTSVDLAGTPLWTYDLAETVIAMPLSLGDGRLFVSASGDTGCSMVRVTHTDAAWKVEELWTNRDMRNHFNSSVVHEGHLYGFDNATLKCLSAETGAVKWAKRGLGKGSLLIAGNRLFVLSDKGLLVMADASPAGYSELGTFQALEDRSWTSPSLAAGRLYVRNLTEMTCLDLRAPA